MCTLEIIEIDRCILYAYLMGKIDDTALDRCMNEVPRYFMQICMCILERTAVDRCILDEYLKIAIARCMIGVARLMHD